MKKRIFAILMIALLLLSIVPSAALADGENSYTLYTEPGGSVYKTAADYDPMKPEMLDMGVTKTGYTFTGWYLEDPSGDYAAETTSETKYYNTTTVEKSTTTPDFSSGTEYYTKVEIYQPLVYAAGTNKYFAVTSNTPVPKDMSFKDAAANSTYLLNTNAQAAAAAEDKLFGYKSGGRTYVSKSKLEIGQLYYVTAASYKTYLSGTVTEYDTYPSSDDVYLPVTYNASMAAMDMVYYTADSVNGAVYENAPSAMKKYYLYVERSTKSPVTSSTYTTGTTVYYEEETKTEITAAEYNASNPNHSTDTVTIPTGVFSPKTSSEPAGTKYYSLASMTPAAAMGAVSYYAGWTDATVPTYTLNDGNGTVSSPIAYDPAAPVALPTPVRDGYTFGGWIDSSSAAVTTTPASDLGNVTFTATWTFANYLTSGKIAKAYNRTFATAAEDIATEDVLAETITYTITAYDSTNREVGKDALDMPAITPVDITVGDGDDKAVIAFPDFNGYGIGDYWYKVVETVGSTAGVTYDTNEYYLHLVVTDEDETGTNVGVSSYGIHTATDVDVTDPDNKVQGFTNVYNSGELSIEKQVTGNMGDPDKYFKVTVTFTAPTGTTVTGPISYTGGFADEAGATAYTSTVPGVIAAGWTGDSSVDVYLKDDATVTFTNIPEGVTYAIVEADYSADGYEPSYAFAAADTGDSASATSATGTIEDASDAVTITNNKDVAVDVGVILEDMPYLLIVGVCVAALVLVVLKRRKHSAD